MCTGKRPTDPCDGVGVDAKFSMPLTLAIGADHGVVWVRDCVCIHETCLCKCTRAWHPDHPCVVSVRFVCECAQAQTDTVPSTLNLDNNDIVIALLSVTQ